MNERLAYRGHRVDMVLLETMRGRYRCIAFVDGEHMSVGPEALDLLGDARHETLLLVQATIDTLEAS